MCTCAEVQQLSGQVSGRDRRWKGPRSVDQCEVLYRCELPGHDNYPVRLDEVIRASQHFHYETRRPNVTGGCQDAAKLPEGYRVGFRHNRRWRPRRVDVAPGQSAAGGGGLWWHLPATLWHGPTLFGGRRLRVAHLRFRMPARNLH